MTGLEKILTDIRQEAEAQAAAIISEAETQAAEINSEAEKTAAEKTALIEKQEQEKARDIIERAKSSAELSRKKSALKAKQEIIGSIIEEAKEKLRSLPNDEYFAVILKLFAKYKLPEDGTMVFGKKDLARLPAGFETKLAEISTGKTVIGTEPGTIPDGFLLIYGGIDINCSFDALFDDAGGELQDIVSKTIF